MKCELSAEALLERLRKEHDRALKMRDESNKNTNHERAAYWQTYADGIAAAKRIVMEEAQ